MKALDVEAAGRNERHQAAGGGAEYEERIRVMHEKQDLETGIMNMLESYEAKHKKKDLLKLHVKHCMF